MKTLTILFALMMAAPMAQADDFRCGAKRCSSGPYGGSCTNTNVRVNLDDGTMIFTDRNDSNAGTTLLFEVADVKADRSIGKFVIQGKGEKGKATFTINVYGPQGVRAKFKSRSTKTIEYKCSNPVIND